MMRAVLVSARVLLTIVCFLAACAGAAQSIRAQTLQEVTIALSSYSFGTAGARMAKDMGLFEKHGIDAKLVLMDTANATTSALISGSMKVALSGSGELVVAQARGQKVVAIVNTFAGLSASIVLSKATVDKLGISPSAPLADRLKALDGLLIASTSPTSTATVSFKTAAQKAGATIRFTYMGQPAMAAALESGAVQGYSAAAPFWAIPVTKGIGMLWIGGPRGELPPESTPASAGNMQVMRDFAEANPDLVGRLVAVFDDLTEFIDKQPAKAQQRLATLYPDIDEKTLALLFQSESYGWRTKHLTVADMIKEIDFVKLGGAQIPGLDKIDPAALIYP
jgi:ABC-type nitrate/sulfonate/bicarbonate transport system substrate-binding protein